MGFNTTAIRFFLATRSEFKNNPKTLVLGRQNFIPSLWLLYQLNRKGLVKEWKHILYIDDFFKCAGINKLDFLDFSPYEGATIIQDLGQPISDELMNSYDLVVDAGTIEHVPDILTALSNLKKMVKIGGLLFIVAPANNFLGHGCYQLSPEIFHRALTADQGFQIKHSVLHIDGILGGRWINVPDSDDVNQRVSIKSSRTTFICIVAQKVSLTTNKIGNQSDYEEAWSGVNKTSRLGTYYLSAPYVIQVMAQKLILQKKYARRSKSALRRIPVHGLLRLPTLKSIATK